jgi:hypothetical protein
MTSEPETSIQLGGRGVGRLASQAVYFASLRSADVLTEGQLNSFGKNWSRHDV